jgi:Y_Y_Y domain
MRCRHRRPVSRRPHTVLPCVLIDEVRIDDRLVAGARRTPFAWGQTEAVTVPAGSQRVEVHYTALSLASPDKVRFMYRIDGLDPDWVDAGARVAYLQDLAPGACTFRVKAANNDSVWNQTGAIFTFTVQPFW